MNPLLLLIPGVLLGFMLVLFFLHKRDREPFLGIWSGAMGLWAVPYILLAVHGPQIAGGREIVVDVALYTAALMFIWGIHLFLNWKVPNLWLWGSALVLLWYLGGIPQGWGLIAKFPTYFFLGAGYVMVGSRVLGTAISRHRWSSGLLLILLGIHQWDYPFLGRTPLAAWGHVIALVLGVGAILSLLLVYRAQRQSHTWDGVYDRQGLEELLRSDHLTSMSLIVVDISGLRWVNDTLGNQQGDRFSEHVIQTIGRWRQPGVLIGRWDQDQILLVLPGVDATEASKQCQEIGQALEALVPGCLTLGWATGSSLPEVLALAQERIHNQEKACLGG